MRELVFATRNQGKLRELNRLVGELPYRFRAVDEFEGAPDVEETGETFLENAVLKALSAYRHTGLVALADDSGLCVEALGGAPGVRSSRFGGVDGDHDRNNTRLLEKMAPFAKPEERRAWFQATLAFVGPREWLGADNVSAEERPEWLPDELGLHVFVGRTYGTILFERRGEGGFGYDPLFLSDDVGRALAELGLDEKNQISHRGRAFADLHAFLEKLAG